MYVPIAACPATNTKDGDMDWFEMNDWILENYPEVHQATKYLSSMSIQMACWEKIYNEHKV